MAISDIISFGFGNGTFTPGVAKLPTLGYSILRPKGPFCFEAVQTFSAGAEVAELFSGGAEQADTFSPGAEAVQTGC